MWHRAALRDKIGNVPAWTSTSHGTDWVVMGRGWEEPLLANLPCFYYTASETYRAGFRCAYDVST